MAGWWKNLSFRLPVFLLLVSLAPLAFFDLYSIARDRTLLLETQARATYRTTVLAALLVEERIDQVVETLRISADYLTLGGMSAGELRLSLQAMIEQNEPVTELTLLDVPDAILDLRKWAGQIKVLGPISGDQVLATAFPKDAPLLRDAFNDYLREIKADGRYGALVDKYYPGIRRYFPAFFAGD